MIPQPTINQDKGKEITIKLDEQLSALKNERSPRDTTDKAICEFLVPYRGDWLVTPSADKYNRYASIVDPEATKYAEYAASGMHIGLTNETRRWFALGQEDEELGDYGPVKSFNEDLEKRVYEVLRKTGFYPEVHLTYLDEIAFGPSCLVASPSFKNLLNWQLWSPGSYYITQDEQRKVNSVWRELYMTAINVVKQFGENNVSDCIKKMAQDSPYTYVVISQAIIPADMVAPEGARTWDDMPYKSFYWEGSSVASSSTTGANAGSGRQLLSAKGFTYFPAIVTRWHMFNDDPYGVGPGHLWLSTIKRLQQFARGEVRAVHNETDPSLLIPSDLSNISLLPGAKNFFDGDPAKVRKTVDYRYDYQAVAALKQDARGQLSRGLYADLVAYFINREGVQPLNDAEVQSIKDEKLLMLGAIVDRECHEKLDAVIDIVYAELERRQLLPPVPEELNGQEIKVEYISTLAQAQKLINSRSIQAMAGFVRQLAKDNPNAMDKFDDDKAIDIYADAIGVSTNVIRDDQTVQTIREARAAELEQRKQQEMLNQNIQNAHTLGTTPLNPDTALAKIEGQMYQ